MLFACYFLKYVIKNRLKWKVFCLFVWVVFFLSFCGKPSSYCYGSKLWLADIELDGLDSHKGNAVFIK